MIYKRINTVFNEDFVASEIQTTLKYDMRIL